MQSVRPLRPFTPAEAGNGMEPSPSPLPNGGIASVTPPLSPPLSPGAAALAAQVPGYSPLSPALLGQLLGNTSPNLASMMGGHSMYHPLQAQQAAAMYAAMQQQPQQQYQHHLGMMAPQAHGQQPQQQPIILLGQHTDEQGVQQPKTSKGKGKKGGNSSSAYASRHMAAEQRRRSRINERFERLRQIVPHCERANMASFLDVVIDYIQELQKTVKDLEGEKHVKGDGKEPERVDQEQVSHPLVLKEKTSDTNSEEMEKSGGGFWDASGFKEDVSGEEKEEPVDPEAKREDRRVQFYSGEAIGIRGCAEPGQGSKHHEALPPQADSSPKMVPGVHPGTPSLSPVPFMEALADSKFREEEEAEKPLKRTRRDASHQ